MKKKLALLLVLSLVLSMIPMNVFGAEDLSVKRWSVLFEFEEGDPATTGAGNDHTATIAIDEADLVSDCTIVVTPDDTDIATFVNETGWAVAKTNVNSTIARDAALSADSNEEAFTYGYAIAKRPIPGVDFVSIDIDYEIADDTGDDVVVNVDIFDVNGRLVKSGSVTLASSRSTTYKFDIAYGDLVEFSSVANLSAFTLTEDVAAGLKSGTQFTFKINQTGFKWRNASDVNLDNIKRFTSTPTMSTATINTTDDSRELSFTISGNANTSAIRGIFDVVDLRLDATERARHGKVTVTVTATEGSEDPEDIGTYTVANYGTYALSLNYPDSKDTPDDLDSIVSGSINNETALIALTELAPDSYPANRSGTLNTRVEVPEGVKIVSAEYQLREVGEDDLDNSQDLIARPITDDVTGFKVTDSAVVFTPYELDKQNDSSDMFEVAIKLYVNVEAGYVAKYGTDEIAVTVAGPAIDNTRIDQKQIVIANVVDPISVELEPATISADTTGAYHANNIVINELYGGALKAGDEVWVGLSTELTSVAAFEALSATVNADSNGLQIGRVRASGNNGILFEITRESDENSEGGSITISDNTLYAFAFSGHSYAISVEGDGISQSHDYNITDYDSVLAAYFTTSPYASPIFDFTASTVDKPNTTTGTDVEVVNTNLPLYDGMMATLSNGNNVNVYKYYNSVGFISARYFADWLGAETTWNNDTKVATITYYGTTVELTLGSTSMKITNGAGISVVDIAQFAVLSGSNPIRLLAEDGAIYLPVRAISNAFGVDCRYANGQTTLSK